LPSQRGKKLRIVNARNNIFPPGAALKAKFDPVTDEDGVKSIHMSLSSSRIRTAGGFMDTHKNMKSIPYSRFLSKKKPERVMTKGLRGFRCQELETHFRNFAISNSRLTTSLARSTFPFSRIMVCPIILSILSTVVNVSVSTEIIGMPFD
jgi:hypothetical protein